LDEDFKANGRVSKSPYLLIKYVVLYIKLDNFAKCSSCSASEVAGKRCSCSSNHIQYKDFRETNMENCCAQKRFQNFPDIQVAWESNFTNTHKLHVQLKTTERNYELDGEFTNALIEKQKTDI
jgi:hypothetical protein